MTHLTFLAEDALSRPQLDKAPFREQKVPSIAVPESSEPQAFTVSIQELVFDR